MGNELDTCICCKDIENISIEVELKSGEKHKFKQLEISNKYTIKENKRASLISKLSNIRNDVNNNDSIISEKNDLKLFLNNKKQPETIIQSIFRGYIYRKKFNIYNGIKQELINENKEIINQIEQKFILKSILQSEKLFINSSFEENWKNFYSEDNNLVLNINNNNNYLIKINCLLSKYR